MIDKEIVRISYTSNDIGSGYYCECGRELTHEEREAQRYKKACCHRYRKEKQGLITVGGKRYYV